MQFISNRTVLGWICLFVMMEGVFAIEGLIEKVHPKLKSIKHEITEKEKALSGLPVRLFSNTSKQFGYHSRLFFEEDHPHWIEIDLEEEQKFDFIALIPAQVETVLYENMDYGFPVKFKIEVRGEDQSLRWEFMHEKGPAKLNGFPFLITCPDQLKGRYVRLTVLKHWKTMEHWTTVLSEMMVFNGEQNIAANKPVRSLEGEHEILPGWSPDFLTDNCTPLGPPVSHVSSPSNGMLMAKGRHIKMDLFFIIDLGEPMEIDRIVLFPSRPTDYADAPGSGFPRRYTILGSLSEDFETSVQFHKTVGDDEINPGDNPVIIAGQREKVRYVKLSAQELYTRPKRNSMSFSEVQIYVDHVNVAPGKEIISPYSRFLEKYPRWYTKGIADGYNSQFKIMPYPDWLKGLVKRYELESEIRRLNQAYISALLSIRFWLTFAFFFLTTLVIVLLVYFNLKANREKKLIQKRIREQIARDLHDEIGSQLGGIALLSGSYISQDNLDKNLKEDLQHISDVAYNSGDSMKDIIWLISEDEHSLVDLVHQFKMITKRILGTIPYEIEESGTDSSEVLVELQNGRHLTLILKEALHNIKKHAQANKVCLAFNWNAEQHEFSMSIQDDGVGFDQSKTTLGHGLKNFQSRAEILGADFSISANEDCGTKLNLKIRLK